MTDHNWGLFAVTAPEEGSTKRGKRPALLANIRRPQSPLTGFRNPLAEAKKQRDHWNDKMLVEDLFDEHGRQIIAAELGYSPRPGSKMVLLDLDEAVTDGEVEPWAQDILGDFTGWVETSTSGTGLRVVMKRGEGDDEVSSAEKANVGFFANGGRAAIITGKVRDGFQKKLRRDAGVIERLLKRRGELSGRDGASDEDMSFLGDRWLLTADEMAECLLSIPNKGIEREGKEDGGLSWIGVLAALKRTYGEELWEAFDEWTAGSEDHKYDPTQNRVRWDQDSIAGGGGSTPEHIIRHALAGGWWALPERLEPGEDDEAAKNYARWPVTDAELAARFVPVASSGLIYDRLAGEEIRTRDALMLRTRGAPMKTVGEDEKGKPKITYAGRTSEKRYTWLRHELEPVDEVVWYPGKPETIADERLVDGQWVPDEGRKTVNVWKPPVVPGGDPALAQRWVDHVKLLYPAEWQEIISVLAWHVQRPGVKLNWAMVLCGSQGIGKDLMLVPLKKILGTEMRDGLSYDKWVDEKWDNDLWRRSLIVMQEAKTRTVSGGKAVANRLKPYIAAPPLTLTLNIKGQGLREGVPNLANWIITTNFADAIYIDPAERRYAVAVSKIIEKRDLSPGYGTSLYHWLNDGGWRHVAARLKTWDISGLGHTPPPWAGTEQMRALGRSDLANRVQEALGDAEIVAIKRLHEKVGTNASAKAVATVLREEFGWEPRLNADGSVNRYSKKNLTIYRKGEHIEWSTQALAAADAGKGLVDVGGDFEDEGRQEE